MIRYTCRICQYYQDGKCWVPVPLAAYMPSERYIRPSTDAAECPCFVEILGC